MGAMGIVAIVIVLTLVIVIVGISVSLLMMAVAIIVIAVGRIARHVGLDVWAGGVSISDLINHLETGCRVRDVDRIGPLRQLLLAQQ